MNLWLREDFSKAWANQEAFACMARLSGTLYRAMAGRYTLSFQHDNKTYFLKRHLGVGWRQIFKDLLYLRLPILGACHEYRAIRHCQALGIATLTPVAYGRRGINPATQHSFLITEALTHTQSLETFTANWSHTPPTYGFKKGLVEQIATISGHLHQSGLNHRDYYLCHFLFTPPEDCAHYDPEKSPLYLIDLHRAQIRKNTPKRWIIKDIAGLWFSALHCSLSLRDQYRFIRHYTGLPLKQALCQYAWLWSALPAKVRALEQRKARYGDRL